MAPVCVHVVITAPTGYDLDMNHSGDEHQMYLDPFSTDGEVSVDRLEQLVWQAEMTIANLRNSGTVFAVTTRAAHNIEASHAAGTRRPNPSSISGLLHGHAALNRQLALYATRWALLILQVPFTRRWLDHLSRLLRHILRDWPEDEWVMTNYVLAQGQLPGSEGVMSQMEAFARNQADRLDRVHPEMFKNELTEDRVAPFRIGQVFVHKRYQWLGAIVGFYEVPTATWSFFDAASESDGAAQSTDDGRRYYIKTM